MYTLALCCMLKDEPESILKEWLVYHVARGVEQFYLYDNESALPVGGQVRAMGLDSIVRVHEWPGKKQQLAAYDHCLEHYGDKCRWIGFIDSDELVTPTDNTDMRRFLAGFPAASGVVLNWCTLSSNDHEASPQGLQIESYTSRFALERRQNRHVKSFVRPERTVRAQTPHHFEYMPGGSCVHPCGLAVNGPYFPADWTGGRIHHHFFRSREDFTRKITRGRAHSPHMQFRMEEFDRQCVEEVFEDRTALDVAAVVRAMMRQKTPDMILAKAREFVDKPADFFIESAHLLTTKGKLDAALDTVDMALALYPDGAMFWTQRATLLRGLERYEDAWTALSRSLALEPAPETYLELFRLHHARGEQDKARAVAVFLKATLEFEHRWDEHWAASLDA